MKEKIVLAFDPGYVNGCKIAVVDPTGKYLDSTVVKPFLKGSNTDKLIEQSMAIVVNLVNKYIDKTQDNTEEKQTSRNDNMESSKSTYKLKGKTNATAVTDKIRRITDFTKEETENPIKLRVIRTRATCATHSIQR